MEIRVEFKKRDSKKIIFCTGIGWYWLEKH